MFVWIFILSLDLFKISQPLTASWMPGPVTFHLLGWGLPLAPLAVAVGVDLLRQI